MLKLLKELQILSPFMEKSRFQQQLTYRIIPELLYQLLLRHSIISGGHKALQIFSAISFHQMILRQIIVIKNPHVVSELVLI